LQPKGPAILKPAELEKKGHPAGGKEWTVLFWGRKGKQKKSHFGEGKRGNCKAEKGKKSQTHWEREKYRQCALF